MTAATPVDILQEFIVIHTTRIEVCTKLLDKNFDNDFKTTVKLANEQSNKFIADLMNELSNFGDAVKADISRENEYHRIYQKMLANSDNENDGESADLFAAMEKELKNSYAAILRTQQDLPAAIIDLLNSQSLALTNTV